jgi:excisionase family DNA binding protein
MNHGPSARLGGLSDMEALDRSDAYLLKPAEVAELLGVSRSWLYEAAKSGRIPCVRLGGPEGPVRFQPLELEAWITQWPVKPSGRSERAAVAAPAGQPNGGRRRPRARADAAQLHLLPRIDN